MRTDALDRKILAELQNNGRISLTELSEKLSLSLSTCQRHVKALEESGIISGYRASVSPEALGLAFSATVFVLLSEIRTERVREFEQALQTIPEIIEAERMFGKPDYILRIVTRDLQSYQQLYDTKLSALPNTRELTSTLVMKRVVHARPILP